MEIDTATTGNRVQATGTALENPHWNQQHQGMSHQASIISPSMVHS